jgi:hypothetical protein
MNMRILVAALAMAAAATTALAQAQAPAQQGTAQRVRGTIDAVDGDKLMVTARDGQKVTLTLTSDTTVNGTTPRSPDDIKPGTFLASAGEKRDDGKIYAVEVRIFPEARNAGQRAFDLGPSSVMTNASVTEVSEVPEGRLVKVTWPDGQGEYIVGPDVPIYVTEPADRSLLVPGAYIVAGARLMPDGLMMATSITAERNGLKPGN